MSQKPDTIRPPWTDVQVKNLNRWQRSQITHPFTCGNDRSTHPWRFGDQGVLVATTEGWHCPDCDFTQDWAHDFMTKEPPRIQMTIYDEDLIRRVIDLMAEEEE